MAIACVDPGHVHRGSNANLPETPAIPGISRASTIHHDHPHPVEGREGRSLSFSHPTQSAPGTPLFTGNTGDAGRAVGGGSGQADQCVIDSTAYFIRTESTPHTPTKEVLIFGDVEPDSISLSPRTAHVWAEAAPKIAAGILTGVFIECSYTNAQGDAVLYGHLAPRHLLLELQNLAEMVKEAKTSHEKEREEARKGRKRKRTSHGPLSIGDNNNNNTLLNADSARKSSKTRGVQVHVAGVSSADDEMMTDYAPTPTRQGTITTTNTDTGTHTPAHPSAPAALNLSSVSAEHSRALLSAAFDAPLKGLKVVVIHVKDTLDDGPLIGECILQELREGERVMAEQGRGLGCVFEVSRSGDSYWF